MGLNCDYVFEATGPIPDLTRVQAFIQQAIVEPRPKELVLDYARLFPEDVQGYEKCGDAIMDPAYGIPYVWVDDEGPYVARIEEDRLVMTGGARWSAPHHVVKLLSRKYPEVRFEVRATRVIWDSGTTDYHCHERHRFVNGQHTWVESCVCSPRDGAHFWLVKDGQTVVSDEEALRHYSKGVLRDCGFTVEESAEARPAESGSLERC